MLVWYTKHLPSTAVLALYVLLLVRIFIIKKEMYM